MGNASKRGRRTNGPRGAASGAPPKAPARQTDRTLYRVVWSSNHPAAPTGYGTQSAQALKRLAADGHDVLIQANYGVQGMMTEWEGIPVYPAGLDQYSNDVVPPLAMEWWQADQSKVPLIITLYDTWVLKGDHWNNLPVVSWVPIDHAPCPPEVADWCRKPNVTPFAMSRFGQRMLEAKGIDSIYVPHALDLKTWKPTPKTVNVLGQEVSGYELMGVPEDAFVVGYVFANKGVFPTRKAVAEQLLAFKLFSAKHSDAVLYIHSESYGMMGGINLHHLIEALEIPENQIRIVDQWLYRKNLPQEFMVTLLSCVDVLMSCSLGEGFGLVVLEAQAVGTPVIVSDFTAQPELVGDGIKVDGQPLWDPMQRSWWLTPNVPMIVNALEEMYARGRGRSEAAIAHAANYDADKVWRECWRPGLEAAYR
jgi:D-inositol-3-phosphate glycosyltransferase